MMSARPTVRRARRSKFVGRQLAIAIFVQRLERGCGVGDFIFIDDAIVVRIESGNQRRRRRAMARTPARTIRRALGAGHTRTRLSLLVL